MKDNLLNILATIAIGLMYLIGILLILGLILGLIGIIFAGCLVYPKIVIPAVIILLSYIIGRETLNDKIF